MADSARIFISYSNKDTDLVERLKTALAQAGVAVWLDHEQLTPGTPDWRAAVVRGIEQATDVVYAASLDAADSRYVGHELAIASDEGKRILPFWVRGEKWSRCAPMGYYHAQYIDGRGATYAAGLAKLLTTLGVSSAAPAPPEPTPTEPERAPQPAKQSAFSLPKARHVLRDALARAPQVAKQPAKDSLSRDQLLRDVPERLVALGYTLQERDGVEWIIPPLCAVPAGPFRLGSDKAHDPQAQHDELQRRTVDLAAFEVTRFPITVAEYSRFIAATGRAPSWWLSRHLDLLDTPIFWITWYDAFDYAGWLAEHTKQPWRLPTEADWEKAARCDPRDPLGASSERIYPWGDRFDKERCNTSEGHHVPRVPRVLTTPVGWFGPDDPEPSAGRRSGASPCGAEDLAGNVWEWTGSAYAVDYSKSDALVAREATASRCLHGGHTTPAQSEREQPTASDFSPVMISTLDSALSAQPRE